MRFISKIRTVVGFVTVNLHAAHTRPIGMFIIQVKYLPISKWHSGCLLPIDIVTRPPACYFYALPYRRYASCAFSTHHLRAVRLGDHHLKCSRKEMVLRYSPSDFQTKMLHASFRHNSILPAQPIILNFITLTAYSEKY